MYKVGKVTSEKPMNVLVNQSRVACGALVAESEIYKIWEVNHTSAIRTRAETLCRLEPGRKYKKMCT